MRIRFKSLLLLIILIFCCNAANAVPVPPSQVEAGTVNTEIKTKNLYKDLIQEKAKEEEKQESQEEPDLKMNVDEYKKLPAEIEKTGFILNKIIYEGNTIFTQEDLDKIGAEYLNNFVSLDDLKVIMNKITNHYNNEGYITTFAYLPAQKIQDGLLKITIVEGKVSKLNVKGNKWAKEGYLKNNVLKANGLKEGETFNVSSLRKSLGKINETDYLKGRVLLNKGDDLESAEITLEVEDRFPLMLKVGSNNQGRDLIGEERAVITLGNENITGWGDRAYTSTTLARNTVGVNTDYYLPLGPYGTEIRAGYGYTNVEVGKAYKSQGFVGKAHGFSTTLFQPIYEGKTVKYTSDLTFDLLNAKTLIHNDELYDKYKLRALRFGLNGIKDDSTGRWIGRFETHVGLPQSKFCRLNPSIVRIQSLPFKTTGIFKASAQFATSNLLSVEQLQLGGMNTVRGYEEGTLLAHSGYFTNLELRRVIPYLPNFKYLPLKDRIELAAFYDQGLGQIRGQKVKSNNFLQSVGFGFRIHLTDYMNANLDFGIPLGGSVTPARKDAMRFHFNILSNVI